MGRPPNCHTCCTTSPSGDPPYGSGSHNLFYIGPQGCASSGHDYPDDSQINRGSGVVINIHWTSGYPIGSEGYETRNYEYYQYYSSGNYTINHTLDEIEFPSLYIPSENPSGTIVTVKVDSVLDSGYIGYSVSGSPPSPVEINSYWQSGQSPDWLDNVKWSGDGGGIEWPHFKKKFSFYMPSGHNVYISNNTHFMSGVGTGSPPNCDKLGYAHQYLSGRRIIYLNLLPNADIPYDLSGVPRWSGTFGFNDTPIVSGLILQTQPVFVHSLPNDGGWEYDSHMCEDTDYYWIHDGDNTKQRINEIASGLVPRVLYFQSSLLTSGCYHDDLCDQFFVSGQLLDASGAVGIILGNYDSFTNQHHVWDNGEMSMSGDGGYNSSFAVFSLCSGEEYRLNFGQARLRCGESIGSGLSYDVVWTSGYPIGSEGYETVDEGTFYNGESVVIPFTSTSGTRVLVTLSHLESGNVVDATNSDPINGGSFATYGYWSVGSSTSFENVQYSGGGGYPKGRKSFQFVMPSGYDLYIQNDSHFSSGASTNDQSGIWADYQNNPSTPQKAIGIEISSEFDSVAISGDPMNGNIIFNGTDLGYATSIINDSYFLISNTGDVGWGEFGDNSCSWNHHELYSSNTQFSPSDLIPGESGTNTVYISGWWPPNLGIVTRVLSFDYAGSTSGTLINPIVLNQKRVHSESAPSGTGYHHLVSFDLGTSP